MANVIITLKIMPESPESNLHLIADEARKVIQHHTGEAEIRVTEEPIAFGLKAIMFTYVTDEKKGSTEPVEHAIAKINGVQSVEVTDVRRAIG